MLAGDLSKVLAHGLKTLYPLKKIEIRRSVVLGTISEELPAPEGPSVAEGSAPAPPESVAETGDAGPA
jgi:ribosomal protein S3AE